MAKIKKIIKREKKLNQTLFLSFSAVILGTVLAMGSQIVLGDWMGPAQAPPSGGPQYEFLNEGPDKQEKEGALTVSKLVVGNPTLATQQSSQLGVKGPVVVEGDIKNPANYSYSGDFYISSPKIGGNPKWASEVDVSFEQKPEDITEGGEPQRCFWISDAVRCFDSPTLIGQYPDEIDRKKFAVVGINFATPEIRCCKPPAIPPIKAAVPMVIDPSTKVDLVGQCSQLKGIQYQGLATVKLIWGQKDELGKPAPNAGRPVDNAIITGDWWLKSTNPDVGTQIKCSDGFASCSLATNGDGIVAIRSELIDAVVAYGAGKIIFDITDITRADSIPPILPPDPPLQKSIPTASTSYFAVGSISVATESTLQDGTPSPAGWYHRATANVKIVNEVGSSFGNIKVNGQWGIPGTDCDSSSSYCGLSVEGLSVMTDSSGIATFTSFVKFCRDVKPSTNPRFVFTVTNVYPITASCSVPYDPNHNVDGGCGKGCGSVSVNSCSFPPMEKWLFGGDSFAGCNGKCKWGWGENVGWNQFQPLSSINTAYLSTNCLEGYLWAENIGWINLGDGTPRTAGNCYSGTGYSNTSATDFGVNVNATNGDLCGYAWGENVGWINFGPMNADGTCLSITGGRVSIGLNNQNHGILSGYAWGENIGWINFNHTQADNLPRFYTTLKATGESCSNGNECVLSSCTDGKCD